MEKLTPDEVIEKVKEFRNDCEMGNSDLFARMEKAERFRNGDQWDPQTRAYRERKNKFCLTIPLIKPQINQVVGSQIQNPKDVVIVPERAGSSTGARIRTKLVKHAMDSEHSIFEMTQWFDAGLASGVGYIGAFIDKHEDPKNGNLRIEKLNEFECGLDPNCVTFDINSYSSGAKYFIWEPWVDKDLIHEQYPDKVDEIESAGEAGSLRDRTGLWSWLWGEMKELAAAITGYHPAGEENITKYKYKVTHTWWRRPKKCVVLYKEGDSEVNSRTFIKDSEIKAAKDLVKQSERVALKLKQQKELQPGEWPPGGEDNAGRFSYEEVIINVMYHTIRIGDVMLDDIEDELNGVTRYPIVPYSAYFSNGRRSGMSEDMIGTQEEINWGHSQNLQILKHMSVYHWKVKNDQTGAFAQWMEEHADEDNLVIDQQKAGGDVDRLQSRPYLGGLDRFVEMCKENLKLISNVRTEDPAFDAKNMSGKAIIAKQLNSQTGQASVFQNFDYALNLFGRLLDEIIIATGVYSPDEIRAIVEEDDLIDVELMNEARQQVIGMLEQSGIEIPEPPQMTNPQPQPQDIMAIQKQMQAFAKFNEGVNKLARPIAEDMLIDEIQNLRKGKYTTKVTLSSYAPTMRMAEHAEVMELNQELLASGHPPLSRKRLIESSEIKNKEEILQEDQAMAAVQGAMQQPKPQRRPMKVGA